MNIGFLNGIQYCLVYTESPFRKRLTPNQSINQAIRFVKKRLRMNFSIIGLCVSQSRTFIEKSYREFQRNQTDFQTKSIKKIEKNHKLAILLIITKLELKMINLNKYLRLGSDCCAHFANTASVYFFF